MIDLTKNPINFFKFAPVAFLLSAILIAGSIFLWIRGGDAKYGIDYKGGHEVIVVSANSNAEDIRTRLEKTGLDNAVVQEFELGSGKYAIRLPGDFAKSEVVKSKIKSALSLTEDNILSSNFVGPTIGAELKRNAFYAIILGMVGMLIYITWRFELSFAMGVFVALFHDVIICLGFYLLAGKAINMGTLAAALTIVGYSVNDTIVIFDRVREELSKRTDFNLKEVINYSMNACMSRTIITSVLTLFSVIALLVFGGGAISDLAFFMTVGLISGTYSTIFIAAPVVVFWDKINEKRALANEKIIA